MRSEHPFARLGNHVELATGFPFKSTGYSNEDSAVRLLRGDNVAQGVLRWEDARRWPQSASDDVRAYALREDDVVLAMDRPWIAAGLKFAHVRRSDLPCLLVQRVARLRAKESLDSRFLRYIIGGKQFTDYILSVQTGTAVPHISASQIAAFEFPLPPMREQRVVGELLGDLDDRIDLLRQTNATLESIAQALFKSWFIDFDPVRAKADGREPEGMGAATAALFPAEFEESALGLIPKGWREGILADLSVLNATSWSARRAPAEVAYVDLAGVKSNVFDVPQRYSFAEAPSRARRELRAGDTLVGTVRPGNRSFGFIALAEPGLTGSTGFAVLSPTAATAAAFVYLCATRDENIDRLAALADGGAYPAVRPELVHHTTCVTPPAPVLEAFHSVASPLLLGIAANAQRAQGLAELRDILLPRLISGKLRLPEAQEQLAGAIA